MNLHNLLAVRAQQRKPLRVALIGAGKCGPMFLSQVRRFLIRRFVRIGGRLYHVRL